MQDILERAKKIKLVLFDVDGVLTDGGLTFGDDGQEYKTFHSRDGLGIKLLQRSGVEVGVITARQSALIVHRMNNLGIEHFYQGCLDKTIAFKEVLDKLKLSPEQVAYAGDDVIDLPVMTKVGLAVAVQDAHSFVKKHSHWITPSNGGRGAARDLCELVMEAQGNLDSQFNTFL